MAAVADSNSISSSAKSNTSKKNPIVFFDLDIGGRPIGRVKMELFANVTPMTAENFRQLCTGEFMVDGKPTGFKGCPFHRVIKDFMIQGGDIVNGDGTGSISIHGDKFDDENFTLDHSTAGLLSSANSGPNTNGCQFFITCAPCEWLDGKHVVFGHVVEGMKYIRMIENIPVGKGSTPSIPAIISMCGQFS